MQHATTLELPAMQISRRSVGIQALWIAGFASLTAIGAQIEVPHAPVPYTLQTMFVLLSGAFLGWRNGAIAQVVYLGAGLIGLPVFAQFGFGPARLLGPTGGYLLAFPLAACAVGLLTAREPRVFDTAVAMVAGLLIIFTCGTLQLNATYFHDLPAAISGGFFIFSWWDLAKLAASVMIFHQVSRRLGTHRGRV
jgi:biotin transport system substrate-specific component